MQHLPKHITAVLVTSHNGRVRAHDAKQSTRQETTQIISYWGGKKGTNTPQPKWLDYI